MNTRERFDVLFDDATLASIQVLIKALIQDVTNGSEMTKAGWIDPVRIEGASVVKLLRLQCIAADDQGHIRLNIEDEKALKQLRKISDVVRDQIEYVKGTAKIVSKDFQKSNQATLKMNVIKDRLIKVANDWVYVVAIGWWKMLANSGMPAPIDDVLVNGFSPRDWLIVATQGAADLALHLAGMHGRVQSFADAEGLFSALGVPHSDEEFPTPIEFEKVGKIEKILRWEEIEKQVPLNVQKAIGFVWFCYVVWEWEGLVPVTPLACSHLSLELWSAAEDLCGAREEDLRLALASLTSLGLAWAPGLITMPELI